MSGVHDSESEFQSSTLFKESIVSKNGIPRPFLSPSNIFSKNGTPQSGLSFVSPTQKQNMMKLKLGSSPATESLNHQSNLQLDKENINSNTQMNSSRGSVSSQLKSRRDSQTRRGATSTNSNSPNKYDKVSSLECRLSGATKAIKSLETTLKEKEQRIQQLEREIEKKNKQLTSQQVKIHSFLERVR